MHGSGPANIALQKLSRSQILEYQVYLAVQCRIHFSEIREDQHSATDQGRPLVSVDEDSNVNVVLVPAQEQSV